MSRFLKFIVHFVVICTIICVVALAVPPFLGVTTEIMDDSGKETNLPMGSVTYAYPVKAEEAVIGDSLLVQDGEGVYRYKITFMDHENKLFKVVDSSVSGGEEITVAVKEYVPKIFRTIPFLGFLLVATESIEGLIVIGLAVLFLIILYVIAELCKKDSDEDTYEDEDPEPGYVKTKKELKREEKERERQYKEEERQIKKEDKQRKKDNKKEKKNRKKIRTGGFVDEIYEDDLEPEEEEQPVTVQTQTATSEAHAVLKKEIAAATATEEITAEPEAPTEAGQTIAIVEQVKEKLEEQKQEPVQEEEPEPAEIKKMAIPAWSAAQLAEAAKRRGDAPEIVRDEITNVTLFDYSDIITEDQPQQPEE